MKLTRKLKESIKTALAMTIAIGIALLMDWDKPMWAGFAVAFISLATIGQSLNKGLMRLFGTFMAAAVALLLISLFAQERWLFMLFLSIWVGLCTYLMGGSKNPYFWNVGAFVCVIICMDGGIEPVNAFDMAMLRTQETGLGILVYSLVSVFLWPSNSQAEFDKVSCQLASTQQHLFRTYRELMNGRNEINEIVKEAQQLRVQEIQQQTRFVQLLAAVETERYELWELRHQWATYRTQIAELSEIMERWHESFTEIKKLDLQELLPELAQFNNEIDQRLTQIGGMLAGDAPTQRPQTIELLPDLETLNKLSYFHKAAFTVFLDRLTSLGPLTRAMFDNISDIRDFVPASASVTENCNPPFKFLPDLDRLLGVVRIMSAMWLAYLALIYIGDLPGGAGVVSMVVPIGMALASSPQLPVSKLVTPAIGSVFFAGLLYIFLMPQLSTFLELGLLIFSVTFAICYVFSAPQQILGRTFGLAIFLSIASISNDQSYSFLVVASTTLMFAVVFIILAITAYIPFSPRPEHAFLRLLGRFFRCSEYLLATIARQRMTRLESWKKAFYTRELSNLPNKLAAWGKSIDTRVLADTTPDHVQVLTTKLQALTYRLQELLEARGSSQAEFLVQELLGEIRSWRIEMQQDFNRLCKDPTAGNSDMFCTRLQEIMKRLELRIADTLSKTAASQLSPQEGENFYRLLGAFRGVSVALIDYVESTDAIHWSRWQEEKF